ncbi:ATP-binding protein [Cesiribacter andamanensis]|uniref:Divergent AAA domain protein n=1 Tax=Cesiribacter andamanensis AMV16 TaxID=1279009 RepID=M7NBQ6_9BACT|nr:ATP-binding protein [Cesiribacter andamanensis]EMR04682.1 Divergent AAA domain protein [Cesiribacter andamanensis AMV16]
MESAANLIKQLNRTDETSRIEVKEGRKVDRSVLETVCAFANEPGLGGGYILLGVKMTGLSLFPDYEATGVADTDKLQSDLASQCASVFNQPIRPDIRIEEVSGNLVMSVYVQELPEGAKPLYFRNEGLPKGAYRRIGPTDQRCTEDDLQLFYNSQETFDSQVVNGSSLGDLDENAIDFYRSLRARVNPAAEELTYDDQELLQSLNCITRKGGDWVLTYAGLLLFGSRKAQRRLVPMVRVDYVRVPGNEWVADPDNRFTTIDMRGSLLLLAQRAYDAVADDLPRGFLLPEGQLQAESLGLPGKVLREAIVNALMHRSYRVHQPIQIIRYSNRIEIKNPGYSLKPTDYLGEPGSRVRNTFIAAVFHETNLAENKGSGIRSMRRLMEGVGMAPPTFESEHAQDQFTARLLLHHFLTREDLEWLQGFAEFGLNDNQKKALIFIREVGAVDNSTYRQLNGCDNMKASMELRDLAVHELVQRKGQGRATYYVPGVQLSAPAAVPGAPVGGQSTQGNGRSTQGNGRSTQANSQTTQATSQTTQGSDQSTESFPALPPDLSGQVSQLGKWKTDQATMENAILALCSWQPQSMEALEYYLQRDRRYLFRKFVQSLLKDNRLKYSIPDMPKHPEQTYKTS